MEQLTPHQSHAPETRPSDSQALLETLLAAEGEVVVAALGEDAWRVAVPESVPLGRHRALPVPDGRASLLEIVDGADRAAALAAWEQMQRDGVGVALVHPLGDPHTDATLTMLDAHREHGVNLAVLSFDRRPAATLPAALALWMPISTRPRQATMHKSLTAVITAIDANLTAMLGWTPEQMIGKRSSEFVHPEDQERALTAWARLATTFASQRLRLRHRCADGSWLWVEIENVHNGAERSEDVDVLAHVSDISDEMAAHEALRRREQLFSRLAESLPTGVLQLQADGAVAYANARLGEILRTDTPANVSGLLSAVDGADRKAVRAAVQRATQDGADSELEVGIRGPAGHSHRRCVLTVVAVADQDGQPGALVCVNDVTKSARLREELRVQAMHDPLTGCLNRSAVFEELERLLSAPANGLAVIYIDLDGFKAINDRLGHAAGDEVLIRFARRLQTLSRRHDLVARLGGDEFLIVCRDRKLSSAAPLIAERVHRALEDPLTLPGGSITLHASIGIARPGPATTVEALIGCADSAMYRAKQSRARPGASCTESLAPPPTPTVSGLPATATAGNPELPPTCR